MLRYRLLIYLLGPLLIGYFIVVAVRNRDSRYLLQRLGFNYPRPDTRPIWIHCASVGEINTALPLLDELELVYPGTELLITTNTPTGASVFDRYRRDHWTHVYLPMDWMCAVSRFFSSINPKAALILETELWPELYSACDKRDIPLAIINARLSNRTLSAKPWLRKLYEQILSIPSAVLTRTRIDHQAYCQLGAKKENTVFVGNLKFAQRKFSSQKTIEIDRPFVLAASTHDDEEVQLVKMWMQLGLRDHLLVIAPRHPERRAEIVAGISPYCHNIALRSRRDLYSSETEVFLLDTIGELSRVMQEAELVFIGGSLIDRGGHNLLEAARFSRPILFGPHMFNFQEEVDLFLENDCAIQVEDINQLATVIRDLIDDKDKRAALGNRAGDLLTTRSGMEKKYLEHLQEFGVL